MLSEISQSQKDMPTYIKYLNDQTVRKCNEEGVERQFTQKRT